MKADLRAVADQLRKQHSELQSRIRELDEKVRKLEKLLSLDLGTALLPLLLSLVCSLARPLHLVFFFLVTASGPQKEFYALWDQRYTFKTDQCFFFFVV